MILSKYEYEKNTLKLASRLIYYIIIYRGVGSEIITTLYKYRFHTNFYLLLL
jgi:hypothetical protein